MPKKKAKKEAKGTKSDNKDKKHQSKTEDKNVESKSSLLLKTTDLTPNTSTNTTPNLTPTLTPKINPKTLDEVRPVSEPTPEPTPRRLQQFTDTPRKRPINPFMFATQLSDEEKAQAARIAALKENELKENEVRKRASAERYKQLSKEQEARLTATQLRLDPKKFNRDNLKEQAAAEERRRNQIRENIKKTSARNSNLALQLVLLVWIVIVIGIFYHVYSTIQLGRISHTSASFRQNAQFRSK